MRAVAVLLVVLCHAKIDGFDGGFVGVDVFFVISGFLITGILAREIRRTGRVSIAGFYARRARRILPASTVTLLGICIASAAIYTSSDLGLVLKDVQFAAVFAANINLALAGTDYFSTSDFVSPVQHFWSLAVEEQFYLVWPALMGAVVFVGARRRGAASASRPAARAVALRRAAVLVLALVVLSFLWSVYRTGADPQMAYYSTFTRTWELSIGALLALSAAGVARLPDSVKRLASWGGLLAIAWAACTYDENTPFPGAHAALPVLGAAMVLAGGIDGPKSGAGLLLDCRPMRFVGNISYSLYLWHWPLLVLPEAYLIRELGLVERVMALLVATALAWLSYRWVERPFHHSTATRGADSTAQRPPNTRGDRRRVVRALISWPLAVDLVLVCVAGVALYDARQASAATVAQQAAYAEVQPGAAPAPEVTNPGPTAPGVDKPAAVEPKKDSEIDHLAADVVAAARLARQNAALPQQFQPSLKDLYQDKSFPPGTCAAAKDWEASHQICPIGDLNASRTIVLWGDSHIGMWMRPLEQIAKDRGYRIVPLIKASCMPLDTPVWYKGHAFQECARFRSWALDQIKRIKPDHVVISGFLRRPLADESGLRALPFGQDDVQFARGAEGALSKLRSAVPQARVSVISDVSGLPQDAGRCLGSKRATMGTCVGGMAPLVASRNAAWKKATGATGANFIDMLPFFCDAQTCPIVIRNVIVYRDSNHLTSTYALRLMPALRDRLGL